MKSLFLIKTILILALTQFSLMTNAQITNSHTLVKISTEYGDMTVKLYNETPLHRDNFIKLVEQGFYNDLLFHRVINGFMIQGGDPQSKNAPKGKQLGSGDVGYTIPAEFVYPKYYHKKGALAAARMGDNVNPQKASSGSQFYITQGKSYSAAELQNMEMRMGKKLNQTQRDAYTSVGGVPFLDFEYTVFGEVSEGLDVIDKIAKAQKDRFGRPLEDIKMNVTIIEEK